MARMRRLLPFLSLLVVAAGCGGGSSHVPGSDDNSVVTAPTDGEYEGQFLRDGSLLYGTATITVKGDSLDGVIVTNGVVTVTIKGQFDEFGQYSGTGHIGAGDLEMTGDWALVDGHDLYGDLVFAHGGRTVRYSVLAFKK